MVAISDFSTFSQITYRGTGGLAMGGRTVGRTARRGSLPGWDHKARKASTYGNAISVLLANTLGLGLALLEGVLVLELGSHLGGVADDDVEAGDKARAEWISGDE